MAARHVLRCVGHGAGMCFGAAGHKQSLRSQWQWEVAAGQECVSCGCVALGFPSRGCRSSGGFLVWVQAVPVPQGLPAPFCPRSSTPRGSVLPVVGLHSAPALGLQHTPWQGQRAAEVSLPSQQCAQTGEGGCGVRGEHREGCGLGFVLIPSQLPRAGGPQNRHQYHQ